MQHVDLEKLEDYIVINLKQASIAQMDKKDLRELDQDFGDGAYAIWSDAQQSIVAFVFDNVRWDEDKAKAWVKKAKQGDVQAEGDKSMTEDVYIHAFDSVLADGEAADENDGLIWKEIIKPGGWHKMDSGRKVEVTSYILQEALRAFEAGLPKFISVPADSHHGTTRGVVPAESNRGFVQRLKMIGDSVFGGFKLTDPQISTGVQDGSIADCSVYLQPDVVHPDTGKKFPWVFRHVLLTNNPLVQDLRPFGDIPAKDMDEGVTVIHYRQLPGIGHKEDTMPKGNEDKVLSGADEIVLTGDAAQEYDEIAGLGLTATEIKALAAQKDAIETQAVAMREKARNLEITSIVKALEEQGEHAGVVQVEGFRHFPVVITAVEKVLRETPQAMALDADENGATTLDAALLDVINAIPSEGRIKVAGEGLTAGDKREKEVPPTPEADSEEAVTDEQADAFIETIGA